MTEDGMPEDWWRSFFVGSHLAYHRARWKSTGDAAGTVERIIALGSLRPGDAVLDVPCGSGRHAHELARRGFEVVGVDACPEFVDEARVRAGKGYTILYVGHAGHDEATGTLAVAPDAMQLVEHEEDLDDVLPEVQDPSKVALLAQTTLSLHDWEGIMDRTREQFPELWTATRNDLCFATTNRQAALTAIATRADAVVVIGSANSSNTIALTKVARSAGCPVVVRVDGPDELEVDELTGVGVVGVTAGASAPEDLVQAVIAKLDPRDGVEPVYVTDEDEYFPPPRELRELVPALDGLAALMVGGDPVDARRRGGPFSDDRGMDASLVLAELAP